ncbi:MAG: SDR family NAD(P)-dependent oxidoreductase [Dehalococcoidia bacterium]
MLLEGKVAVVTGGAEGVGRGIAIGMAEEGANVVTLDIDGFNNAETARRIQALGRKALALDCDISDKHQVRRAMAEALNAFGRFDVLVNNAAIYGDTRLTVGSYESQSELYERCLDVCTLGGYYCALAAVPAMAAVGGGNILNVITEHIKEGHMYTGSPATGYDSAKWAQWRQTESWAVELKPLGIRVNALCHGATDSPMLRKYARIDPEKVMMPEDVAVAALNVIRQGPEGPTGQAWVFGYSGSGRAVGRAEAEAILHRTAGERVP